MLRHTLPLALLLASPAALAADHELSVDVGTLLARDAGWDAFSDSDVLPQFGVRAGVRVHDRVAAIATWQYSRHGADYHANNQRVARAAFFGNEIGLGAKADLSFADFFLPYASASAVGLVGHARFDDRPNDDDNIGQIAETALSFGGRGMLGMELRLPREHQPGFTVGGYLEGGYTWLTDTQFEQFGDVTFRGFTFRTGIGVRY